MADPVNYDQLAPTYDRRYQNNRYDGVESVLLEFIGENRSRQMLEVGCGTGHWVARLDRAGFSVAGLEPSEQMVSKARSKAPQARLRHGYAEKIPWDDSSFDRVFVINAFHHFEGKAEFLTEAYRVLRPGGGLMIMGIDPHAELDQWYSYDYFPGTREAAKNHHPSRKEIVTAMRINGFSRCHTTKPQRMCRQFPARQAIETGQIDKNCASQLALLTDQEYECGINRIWRDIEAAEARGEQLQLVVDLRLYATIGWA